MEAASARFAARDRFAGFNEPALSPLQRYIQRAVDPQNFEADLAMDLEIADLINTKKGNAPREAAVAIVNFINHRNPNVSLLALTLLDICVKNCGYPFHLQIATKEFLNELVRRFPEHPPRRPTRVQARILEAIEEWRQTICQTSRYKEDLGFIRDMHRLLSYKGYVFPEVRREDAAVLNPSDNLKSAEEMEEEEKTAQSAKLQELIRKGGPQDLQEANRLMKIMAGYDTKNKTDYRAKAAEEVSKIQQKAKLLEERLQNFKAGDKMTEGDVFEDLASSLQSAQPKIQKMCEEESDDHDAVAKLFGINDSIHRTIERYKFIKSGDVESAQKIPHGTLGTSTGVGKNANNELSLIDFGGDQEPDATGTNTPSTAQTQSVEDDLLGLSLGGSSQNYGQGGGIALGYGANTNVPGPSLLSSLTQQSSAKTTSPAPTPQSHTPTPSAPQALKPNYDAFASLSRSSAFPQTSTPPPSSQQPQQQSSNRADPFSGLAGLTSQSPQPSFPGLPSHQHNGSVAAQTSNLGQQSSNHTTAEDDWNFSSALPVESLPSTSTIVVSEKDVGIVFEASRDASNETTVKVLAKLSNKTSTSITEYTFQVAVSKAYSLKLTPQSGRKLQPMQRNGITQPIEILGVPKGQTEKVKIRWKASYKSGGETRQEQGEVPPLGIA